MSRASEILEGLNEGIATASINYDGLLLAVRDVERQIAVFKTQIAATKKAMVAGDTEDWEAQAEMRRQLTELNDAVKTIVAKKLIPGAFL